MLKPTILISLLFSCAIPAQSIFVPDNNASTGGCNVIPFGSVSRSTTWSNQRYQQMVTVADFGTNVVANICDIAFAPCSTSIRHFDTIEIKFAQTKATTLSTTFASNLSSNVVTVLKASNYDWHHQSGTWSRIGLDKQYLWLAANGNLVIDITVTGAFGGSGMHRDARQRVYAYGWSGSAPTSGRSSSAALKVEINAGGQDLGMFGKGCQGSNGRTPALALTGAASPGSTVNLDLTDGPATAVAFISVNLQRFASPLDLRPIGAPNCFMYHNNILTLAGVTSTTGTHNLPIKIPSTVQPNCDTVLFQYFCMDAKANAFGMTTSNYGRALVGK